MHQNAQICKLNFKYFPPYRGGATAALPRLHPVGAPALRAYRASFGAFGPSIVPQPEILDPPLGAHTL